MKHPIHLADNLSLPLDFATERVALLARTGAGKSGGMRVEFEQFIDNGIFTIFVDPKGDAYGIRAEGKGPGKPVLIMGGDHGDVPLTPDGGKIAAEFLVRERVSTVVDISEFGHKEMWRFGADFTQTLYKLNRDVAHLFMDEIDMLAGKEFYDPHCLHGIQQIQNKGRFRGWGFTLASQRPQLVNNTVLNASGTYILMQTIGDDALKVVKRCLGQTCSREVLSEIMSQLPTLKNREALVYSPQILGLKPLRVTFAEFQTYDSMRTPRPGETRQQPKSVADIDLGVITRDMAATIEKVKAEDPTHLKTEVANLKRDVARLTRENESLEAQLAQAEQSGPPVEVEVPVPVLDEEGLAKIETAIGAFHEDVAERCAQFVHSIDVFLEGFKPPRTGPVYDALLELRRAEPKLPERKHTATVPTLPSNATSTSHVAVRRAPVNKPTATVEGVTLAAKQQKILDTLLTFEGLGRDSVERSVVAAFVGMKSTGGGFNNYCGALRSGFAGECDPLIEYVAGSMLSLTPAGRGLATTDVSITSVEDCHKAWLSVISTPKQKAIVQYIVSFGKDAQVPREQIAGYVGMESSGGGFNNYLGGLRTLGIIDYGTKKVGDETVRTVHATSLLFPEGLA